MMSTPVVEAQIRIAASTDDVYQALIDEDALRAWFAEDAAVSVDEGKYEFSGRYIVGTPAARPTGNGAPSGRGGPPAGLLLAAR